MSDGAVDVVGDGAVCRSPVLEVPAGSNIRIAPREDGLCSVPLGTTKVYSPRSVGRVNDYDLRIAHTLGEHVWHVHASKEASAAGRLTGAGVVMSGSVSVWPHRGLYDLDVDDPVPASCSVAAWRPAVPGISEVFHARIADYAYPAHCHDTWTVLIVDAGATDYDLDRRHCAASPVPPFGAISAGQGGRLAPPAPCGRSTSPRQPLWSGPDPDIHPGQVGRPSPGRCA